MRYNTKHGMSRTRIYGVWGQMLRRCYTPSTTYFRNYGGRGITVCDRWRHSFENFLGDMGYPPDGLMLDRVDNNGPYSPENCRWTTASEQARNRRSNIYLTIDGVSKCIADWSVVSKVKRGTIQARYRRGWPPTLAVFQQP